MRCLIHLLQVTTVARWYDRALGGARDNARATYIQAAMRVATATGTISRAAVVAEAEGKSSSTFYHEFGSNADGALAAELSQELRPIATTGRALSNHLAEVLVASYWPYRAGWLDALRTTSDNDRTFAAETLVLCVARWAREVPALAAQSDTAPIVAVEDLLIIAAAPVPAMRAASLLAVVVALARRSGGDTAPMVLESVRDDLGALISPAYGGDGDGLDALATRLGETIAYLRYQMPRLPAQRARQLAASIRPQLRVALDLLGDA